MSEEVKRIYTRLPDEEGGYIKFPACLVSANVALAVFEKHLEVHLIEATGEPYEYDLLQQSSPMFYVGDNVESALKDVATLTLVEFARKYTHSDFVEE